MPRQNRPSTALALVVSLGLALGSLAGATPVSASTTQVINNSAIRFGNGTQASIGSTGLLRQPFYYSGSSWRKLTFSSYPLDLTFGYGTGNGSQWNGNTVYSLSEDGTQPVTPVTVNYSGLTLTSGLTPAGGWGVTTSRADFSLGGASVRFEHKYSLGQNDDFVRIETKVTNNSANPLPASSIWVGTRDDFVGGSDVPNKKRGNISQSGFTAITNPASASNAIQISTAQEGVLFYSVSDNASSVVNGCCSFSNVVTQNPSTSTVDVTSDGSYAMYFPLGNLAAGASATVVWFYAAGSIQDLSAVVQQVAAAGAAEQTLNSLTSSGGTLNYNFNYSGTAYYLVVDRGATAPTAAQVVSGSDYGSVTARRSGNAVLTGSGSNWSTAFNITNLNPASQYTVYTATQYPDPANAQNTLTSSVTSVNFSTLATAPTNVTVTPGDQQLSVAFTAPANITNIQYSLNGGSTWLTRSPVSVASPLVITGLTNGTSYDVQIRGVFDSQGGVATATSTASAGSVPGVPQNLSVTYGATSGATVSWSAPASNGGFAVSGYVAEYQKGTGSWTALTVSGTSATISDVWVNTVFNVRISATNSRGNSAYAEFSNNPVPSSVTGGGTTNLVTPTNQTSITATPGQSVVGTISNGVVTPVAATITRITATTASDIQTQADSIISSFNAKWDGAGANSTPAVTAIDTPTGALIYGLVANPVTNAPIGVPATDVILITTNDQAVMLAATNESEPAKLNANGALIVNDGSTLGFAVNGFAPNTTGELVLLSTPTMLGTFTTDPNGSFAGQAVVPNGFPVGNHTAVLITAGLVTSMGLVVEGRNRAPIPYTGPLLTDFSTRVLLENSSSTVTVSGFRTQTVTRIEIDSKNVPFTRTNMAQLVLQLPALRQGVYDLVLFSDSGRLIHQDAFTVSPPAPSRSRVNVGSFNGKLVVYAFGLNRARISWKVGGVWGQAVAVGDSLNRFNRPTPRRGAVVPIEIFVNGVRQLTTSVLTR